RDEHVDARNLKQAIPARMRVPFKMSVAIDAGVAYAARRRSVGQIKPVRGILRLHEPRVEPARLDEPIEAFPEPLRSLDEVRNLLKLKPEDACRRCLLTVAAAFRRRIAIEAILGDLLHCAVAAGAVAAAGATDVMLACHLPISPCTMPATASGVIPALASRSGASAMIALAIVAMIGEPAGIEAVARLSAAVATSAPTLSSMKASNLSSAAC